MADTDTEQGIAALFAALADTIGHGHDILDAMDALVQASTSYTSAVEAGIVLTDRAGVLHVVASTSERATEVEEEQLGTDEGPCWDAFEKGAPVEIPDIRLARDRWPRFAAAADREGFRAAHAVPLRLRSHRFGSLNLFSRHAGGLSDEDAALAQAFADVGTISIIQQRRLKDAAELAAELQAALEGRIAGEQAKGMIAERHGISIEEAFRLLRSYAHRSGAHLRDVAQKVTVNELVI
jgi:ANTAR domain/GAF domain